MLFYVQRTEIFIIIIQTVIIFLLIFTQLKKSYYANLHSNKPRLKIEKITFNQEEKHPTNIYIIMSYIIIKNKCYLKKCIQFDSYLGNKKIQNYLLKY